MSCATLERPIATQIQSKAVEIKQLLKKVEPKTIGQRPQELNWNKGWSQFNKPRG